MDLITRNLSDKETKTFVNLGRFVTVLLISRKSDIQGRNDVLLLIVQRQATGVEVWFLSHVWCPAPMSQYAISKWLPKVFI